MVGGGWQCKEITGCYRLEQVQTCSVIWAATRLEKPCLRGCANNKGADQPAHPHSLINVFVIRFLESIISRLATSEITIF